MRLENKIAIVTGAGQSEGATIGNGRATALRFAQEGASVFLTDRNICLLYTSPSPRDRTRSRMPSSA